MRLYRVNWRDGAPFIESGEVVMGGKNGKARFVRFPNDEKARLAKHGHETMLAAIAADIANWINIAERWRRCGKQDDFGPWDVARVCAKLTRLRRKLERHHLA